MGDVLKIWRNVKMFADLSEALITQADESEMLSPSKRIAIANIC